MQYRTLAAWMAAHNMKDEQMAEKLRLSVSFVNRLRHGHLRPSSETALRIETVTGIPFKDLMLQKRNN